MTITSRPQSLGPYRLIRPLRPCALSARWLAQHERDQTNHVLYEFDRLEDRGHRRRFLSAVERLIGVRHPHLLGIDQFSLCDQGSGYLVTPFTGDQDGLLLLSDLVEKKPDGLLPVAEVGRAMTHVLQAMAHAHANDLLEGEIDETRILVDRHGSLLLELYGLERALRGETRCDAEGVSDEIASVARLTARLLTGVDDPGVRPSKVLRKLDKAWDRWIERGLDPVQGFEDAFEALSLLPSNGGGKGLKRPQTPPTVVVRSPATQGVVAPQR